jgi:5'-3' exonuclease
VSRKEFHSFDGIYQNIASMKESKRKSSLIEHKKMAELSRELATVTQDVSGFEQIQLESFTTPLSYSDELFKLLDEFELKNIKQRLWAKRELKTEVVTEVPIVAVNDTTEIPELSPAIEEVLSGAAKPKTIPVLDRETWNRALKLCAQSNIIGFDTETRGEKTLERQMVGFSLCASAHESFYIPLRHQNENFSALSISEIFQDLTKVFTGKTLVAQNFKYDYKILLNE